MPVNHEKKSETMKVFRTKEYLIPFCKGKTYPV